MSARYLSRTTSSTSISSTTTAAVRGVPIPEEDSDDELEESVPWPQRPDTAKNIVLCLDGTGKQFSAKNSNIMKIFECLVKDEPDKQVVYYQTGVGTTSERSLITPITARIKRVADLTIGWYLDHQVIEAYKFIQAHYNAGDRICMFGYSRGAYTARALCGFLHAIGLLPKSNVGQVEYAYQVWKTGDALACAYYKNMMSSDVDIEFVGCFDTVASVGLLIPRVLPFSTHNGKTRVFRHALALDEYRVKFRQETWHYSLPEPEWSVEGFVRKVVETPMRWFKEWWGGEEAKGEAEFYKVLTEAVRDQERRTSRSVDIKEVWFAGGHGDVGGASFPDFYSFGLSNVTLRWMMKEAIKSGSCVLFDSEKVQRYAFRIPPLTADAEEEDEDARYYDSIQGNASRVAEHRRTDVESPAHLSLQWKWWPLEFVPVLERKQAKAGSWVLQPRINWFRSRTIPEPEAPNDPDGKKRWAADRAAGIPIPGPMFHRSVRERMDMTNKPDVYSRSWRTLWFKGKYTPYAEPPAGYDVRYVE